MSGSGFTLDMAMMYALHRALRRDVERVARIASARGGDPARMLATAAGWSMFQSVLRVHHTSEDDALWPVMRAKLTGWPDELALLDAMEDEHAAIDPLLAAINAELADPGREPGRIGELADALAGTLGAHLRHEEADGLALIDATLDEREWAAFGQLHRERIGTGVEHYVPWLLEGAGEADTAEVLGRLPEQAAQAYRDRWRAAYAALDRWGG